MNDSATIAVTVGARIADAVGRRLGVVDATFADYVLVRTGGLLPIDLYIPTSDLAAGEGREELRVAVTRDEAIERWHRPLKRAPHD